MEVLSEKGEYYIVLNNEKYNIKDFNLTTFNMEKKSEYCTIGWLGRDTYEIPRYKVGFNSNYIEVKSFYIDEVSDNRVLKVLNIINYIDDSINNIINLKKDISHEYKKRPYIDWAEIKILKEEINNNIDSIKEMIKKYRINILESDIETTIGLYEAIGIPKVMISIYEEGVI